MASVTLPDSLSDGVVELRSWAEDDVAAMVAALSDPEISLWIPLLPYPYSRADAQRFIDLARREAAAGRMAAGGIFDADDDRVLGGIGLSQISLGNKTAEVGYWVARGERGRGVATRATTLILGWAFDELELERISLLADVDNAGSRRVARKLGFSEEGVLRSHLASRRGRRDAVIYSLLRNERGRVPDRPALPARVSLITIGARDPARMQSFYRALGWPVWAVAEDGFTGFATAGAVLALYPLDSLAADARIAATAGRSQVTFAINVEGPELVDTAIHSARAAGAEIVKEAVDADWGGRSGYFADPEGNRWEVAWMPGSAFDARGGLIPPRADPED